MSTNQEVSHIFMGTEGSLLCWQEPAACLSPEPDDSSPCLSCFFNL